MSKKSSILTSTFFLFLLSLSTIATNILLIDTGYQVTSANTFNDLKSFFEEEGFNVMYERLDKDILTKGKAGLYDQIWLFDEDLDDDIEITGPQLDAIKYFVEETGGGLVLLGKRAPDYVENLNQVSNYCNFGITFTGKIHRGGLYTPVVTNSNHSIFSGISQLYGWYSESGFTNTDTANNIVLGNYPDDTSPFLVYRSLTQTSGVVFTQWTLFTDASGTLFRADNSQLALNIANWVFQCQSLSNRCESDSRCCSKRCIEDLFDNQLYCVPENMCRINGDVVPICTIHNNQYCWATGWEEIQNDGASCEQDCQCSSGHCYESLNQQGKKYCCSRNCVANFQCFENNDTYGDYFCNNTWVEKKGEGEKCGNDFECKEGDCKYIQFASLCCALPRCVSGGDCVDEGTRQAQFYCHNGTWIEANSLECTDDYQCESKLCVEDPVRVTKICCNSTCVYDGVCYNKGDHAAEQYCDGSEWKAPIKEHAACSDDYQCETGYCGVDLASGQHRCTFKNGCYYEGILFEENSTRRFNNVVHYCVNGEFIECFLDSHCNSTKWCTKDNVCTSPICGNSRCEPEIDCVDNCKDCSLDKCIGDGKCVFSLGETCLTSSDCNCSIDKRCQPQKYGADQAGCVQKVCGDGFCDIDLDECKTGCDFDCNVSLCMADKKCNIDIGENCQNTPEQCFCEEGWSCVPENSRSNEIGCFSAQCGDHVCDIDKGECKANCADCTLEQCTGDGFCGFMLNNTQENCENSVDCNCTNSSICNPSHVRADGYGCFVSVCGDNICESDESCESCFNDCKDICKKTVCKENCILTEFKELTGESSPDGKLKKFMVMITNNYTDQEVKLSFSHSTSISHVYEPDVLVISPLQQENTVITLDFTQSTVTGDFITVIYLKNQTNEETLTSVKLETSVPSSGDLNIVSTEEKLSLLPSVSTTKSVHISNPGDTDIGLEVSAELSAALKLKLDTSFLTLGALSTEEIFYTIEIPKNAEKGIYDGKILFNDGNRQWTYNIEVDVLGPKVECGNGLCEEGETCDSCEKDCDCLKTINVISAFRNLILDKDKHAELKVTLANVGDYSFNSVQLIVDGHEARIVPNELALRKGDRAQVTITFKAFSSAKTHDISIYAKSNDYTSEKQKITITVKEKQDEIVSSEYSKEIALAKADFTSLKAEIEQFKAQYNLTQQDEEKLNSLLKSLENDVAALDNPESLHDGVPRFISKIRASKDDITNEMAKIEVKMVNIPEDNSDLIDDTNKNFVNFNVYVIVLLVIIAILGGAIVMKKGKSAKSPPVQQGEQQHSGGHQVSQRQNWQHLQYRR